MNLFNLIKVDREPYMHYSKPDPVYAMKCYLRMARDQGVLPEICSRLGISLRSTQRWLVTRKVPKLVKNINKRMRSKYRLLPSIEEDPKEHVIEFVNRKNKKKKSLNLSKSNLRLLMLTISHGYPIPDKEPTNKDIMKLLLKFKSSLGTWKAVSRELRTEEMILYRFRKTGKMRKSNRILFHMMIVDGHLPLPGSFY